MDCSTHSAPSSTPRRLYYIYPLPLANADATGFLVSKPPSWTEPCAPVSLALSVSLSPGLPSPEHLPLYLVPEGGCGSGGGGGGVGEGWTRLTHKTLNHKGAAPQRGSQMNEMPLREGNGEECRRDEEEHKQRVDREEETAERREAPTSTFCYTASRVLFEACFKAASFTAVQTQMQLNCHIHAYILVLVLWYWRVFL